ncbi:MAG: hypothetical protein ACTSYS_13010 [Promethearchaeota archaeon]
MIINELSFIFKIQDGDLRKSNGHSLVEKISVVRVWKIPEPEKNIILIIYSAIKTICRESERFPW